MNLTVIPRFQISGNFHVFLNICCTQTTSANFIYFSSFFVHIKIIPQRISISITELQCHISLKHKFHNAILLTYHLVIYFQCSDTMHNKEPAWSYLHFWTVMFKCQYCDESIKESSWQWKIRQLPLRGNFSNISRYSHF